MRRRYKKVQEDAWVAGIIAKAKLSTGKQYKLYELLDNNTTDKAA